MAEQRRIVTSEPENSETPLERSASWVTPNRLFFVRNHFQVPAVDINTWRLRIAGSVDRPRDWTYEEICALPERTVFATMECAGNGRSFLSPHVHGVQWGAGAIGHAEWTGVPLRTVLEKSGVRADTAEHHGGTRHARPHRTGNLRNGTHRLHRGDFTFGRARRSCAWQ